MGLHTTNSSMHTAQPPRQYAFYSGSMHTAQLSWAVCRLTSFSPFTYICLFVFLVLKPFRPICAIAGLREVGQGMTVILGEMDVARVNPSRSGQGEPPVHMAWFAPQRLAAATQFRGGGGMRHEATYVPGVRFPPSSDSVGCWGMGDGTWRRQKRIG